MRFRSKLITVGGLLLGAAHFGPSQRPTEPTPSTMQSAAANNLVTLPPSPTGRSTIFGGQIQKIDPVRDELALKVFGERSMRIFFDERTELYSDGKKIPLHELSPSEHASVQTTLDGAKIFAVSIHILTHLPEGEYEGRISSYTPATGELAIVSATSHQPLRLHVQPDAKIIREGQSRFASAQSGPGDLAKGALIKATFLSAGRDEGVADEIEILAIPGSAFEFSGTLSSIDMHAGRLTLINAQNTMSYQINFDRASFPGVDRFKVGDPLRVTADYDGTRYQAQMISAN